MEASYDELRLLKGLKLKPRTTFESASWSPNTTAQGNIRDTIGLKCGDLYNTGGLYTDVLEVRSSSAD
jgi:hypothetical protein